MFFGGRPGFQELLVILVIALIIFGPKKLPEIGSALGKSLREFKKATNEMKKSISLDDDGEPAEKEEKQEKAKTEDQSPAKEESEEPEEKEE